VNFKLTGCSTSSAELRNIEAALFGLFPKHWQSITFTAERFLDSSQPSLILNFPDPSACARWWWGCGGQRGDEEEMPNTVAVGFS